MKWRNERGDTETGGMFWGLMGAILFWAALALVAAMGGAIAGALGGDWVTITVGSERRG